MSVSKWAYTPEVCDGKYCVGDCDKCGIVATIAELMSCKNCVHNDKPWHEEPCDSCCKGNSGFERKGERKDD